MKKQDVSKFNFWKNKPKDIQPTRTIQDIKKNGVARKEFAAICCPCSGCDN